MPSIRPSVCDQAFGAFRSNLVPSATLGEVAAIRAGSPSTARRWATALRQRFLRIDPAQALLSARGAIPGSPAAGERLETIGRTFLAGYNTALAETHSHRLALVLD